MKEEITFLYGVLNCHAFRIVDVSGSDCLTRIELASHCFFSFGLRQNPFREEKVRRMVSMFELNGYITNSDVGRFLVLSNASCCSYSQIQAPPFFRRGRMVLVMYAQTGTNNARWFARPNAHTSLTVLGAGNSLMAANFFSSGLMPFSEIMCSANLISVPISIFFCEILILFSLHLSSTVRVWLISSSSVSALIIVSSTSFLAHVSPSVLLLWCLICITIQLRMHLGPLGLGGI